MTNSHSYVVLAIVLVISAFGIFGNTMVIYAVRKYKDLETKHGCLLSFLCFYQSVLLVLEIIAAIRNLSVDIATRSQCYYSLIPLMFVSNAQLILVLVLPLDLVVLVLRPTRYNTIQLFPYTILVQIPCLVFAGGLLIASVLLMDNDKITVCDMLSAYPSSVERLRNFIVIAVCVVIVGVYALISLEMWYRDLQNIRKSDGVCKIDPSMRYQRKIIRTLYVTVVAFLCSNFASSLLIFAPNVVPFLGGDFAPYMKNYALKLGLISCAQNFYVYYAMSKDFRKAFKKTFRSWKTWKEETFRGSAPVFHTNVSTVHCRSRSRSLNARSQ